MTLVLAAALALLLFVVLPYVRRKRSEAPAHEEAPALDRWIRDALEVELAEGVLGLRSSTPAERKKLRDTLDHEPDADVVTEIERKVKSVEVEYVRYAHETEVEVTLRVRYERGEAGTARHRFALTDIPKAILADFETKKSTRVYRSWPFPWQRVHAL